MNACKALFYLYISTCPMLEEIGDVILKVDDEESQTRLDRYARYISASTPHALKYYAVRSFLKGPDNSIVRLQLRGSDNQIKEAQLPRDRKFRDPRDHPDQGTMKMLSGNIGYADLVRLGVDQVDEMFEKFKSADAIIFDMRGYPTSDPARQIAERLTDKRVWKRRPMRFNTRLLLPKCTRTFMTDMALSIAPYCANISELPVLRSALES